MRIQAFDFAKDPIASREIELAVGLVAQHQVDEFKGMHNLTIDDFPDFDETEEFEEFLDSRELLEAWNEKAALQAFTLAGWMGELVFAGLDARSSAEQKAILENTNAQEGKESWYRLLCLGSLLGVKANSQTVLRFWTEELATRRIFDSATGAKEFAAITDELFHRSFNDLNTAGENADMWRRVFYDFQKLRLFVFEDDLPGAFLQQIENSKEWDEPINFLKSGFRKGDSRWPCPLGQSMSAPLFWIMRELRRINVIDSASFDSSCFYVNEPTRRIALRLGWLDDENRRAYGFEELLRLSEKCQDGMSTDLGSLVRFYDLPLQWFAHRGSR